MRIAMWSGPRNLSTAMMYSFGARPDFAVIDEPYYAAYLARTGAPHPMADQIVRMHETDPGKIAKALTGPIPDGKPHYYQKHMPHHMCPAFDLGWTVGMRHVFLIRHPARVVASYAAKAENPGPTDLGFSHQISMFEKLSAMGDEPLVIDSEAIRAEPSAALLRLCEALGLPFDPAMLRWPSGGHRSDGVWARHWYGAVHRSTGFGGPEAPLPDLTGHFRELAETGMAPYLYLRAKAEMIQRG